MGDTEKLENDNPRIVFDVQPSPTQTKDQIGDTPENNYPKLFVRRTDSDIEDLLVTTIIQEDVQNNLFSPKNGEPQVPNEDEVITNFLSSISTSFKKTKLEDFDAQDKNNVVPLENVRTDKILIDTAAPIPSVKAAVSKFGGIVDWKGHRVETLERRNLIEQEIEQAQEEIPIYKKQYQDAEATELRLLKELDSTKRLVEELKLNVERVQIEEQQAKQDTQLAKLRVEELEEGIADEASISTKAQLEVACSRHVAAKAELKTVQTELEQLRKEHILLVSDRARAVIKAEASIRESKEAERFLEEMTVELIDMKESLGLAHGAHLEAEEKKIGASEARDSKRSNCEMELKEVDKARERLQMKIIDKKDKKKKLDTDVATLAGLKTELAAYVETKMKTDSEQEGVKKEAEEVKLEIGKHFLEINSMKMSEVWLKSEIENERSKCNSVKKTVEPKKALVMSLEEELNEIQSRISYIRTQEKERREKLKDLPLKLQIAALKSDKAKTLTQLAREQLEKQKIETNQAKDEANAMESRLVAAQKESEGAKASEKLAQAAIDVSKENENNTNSQEGPITLSLKEYYVLSKRSHEAQERANALVASVDLQLEIAKESESKTLKKLEEASLEMEAQKEALVVADHKAESDKDSKLSAEQELRTWRAANEQRRREYVQESRNPRLSFEKNSTSNFIHVAHTVLPQETYTNDNITDASTEDKGAKKKKKFFPRIYMFLARRKHANKSKG